MSDDAPRTWPAPRRHLYLGTWRGVKSWPELAARSAENGWFLDDFVQQVAASRYASGLYGVSAMHGVLIAPTPEIQTQGPFLLADRKGGMMGFEYVEKNDVERRWRRTCDPKDAFQVFEHFLRLQRWFVEYHESAPPPPRADASG